MVSRVLDARVQRNHPEAEARNQSRNKKSKHHIKVTYDKLKAPGDFQTRSVGPHCKSPTDVKRARANSVRQNSSDCTRHDQIVKEKLSRELRVCGKGVPMRERVVGDHSAPPSLQTSSVAPRPIPGGMTSARPKWTENTKMKLSPWLETNESWETSLGSRKGQKGPHETHNGKKVDKNISKASIPMSEISYHDKVVACSWC